MERRLLFDPAAVREWSVAESTLETSSAHTRTPKPVLHWHITVDHYAGEPNYPIGWPRVACALREAAARDWSAWDFLDMWVYTETSRPALPREPVGLTLQAPDKQAAFTRPLVELKPGQWVRIRIPLTLLPRANDVRLFQLHISESNYRHQDRLDFYLDEIALVRYAQPTLLDFTSEQSVVFAGTRQLPVRFNLAGATSGHLLEVACELRQGSRRFAQATVRAARGPQRALFDLSPSPLQPGDYELVARAVGAAESASARLRVVASPWD